MLTMLCIYTVQTLVHAPQLGCAPGYVLTRRPGRTVSDGWAAMPAVIDLPVLSLPGRVRDQASDVDRPIPTVYPRIILSPFLSSHPRIDTGGRFGADKMTSISSSTSPPDPLHSGPSRNRASAAIQSRAKRSSKACESCRVRRTRCSGTVPCDACIANGIATTCQVRIKARPQR
jgi:hypothetical protein